MPTPRISVRESSPTGDAPEFPFTFPEILRMIIERGPNGWTTEPGKDVEETGDPAVDPFEFLTIAISFNKYRRELPGAQQLSINLEASDIETMYNRLKEKHMDLTYHGVKAKYEEKLMLKSENRSIGDKSTRDWHTKALYWTAGKSEGYEKKPKQPAVRAPLARKNQWMLGSSNGYKR
ncbi:MAG: hypothetical protein Q9182_005344 [Xanthomendoza sp. 2 TL-2023]